MRLQGRFTVRGYGESHGFSGSERETLELAIANLGDEEIAERLRCGVASVKTYWKRMQDKTGLSDRNALRHDVIRWLSDGKGRRSSGVFPRAGAEHKAPAPPPRRSRRK
jgi:DNA-binding CsgD family transcriptional regulator